MVDYSRFDHIGSDSDSGDDGAAAAVPKPSAAATTLRPPASTSTPNIIGSSLPQQQAAASSAAGGSSSGGREEWAGGSDSFPQPVMMASSKKGKEGRIKFEHEGSCVCVCVCVRLSSTDDRYMVDAWLLEMRHVRHDHQTDHPVVVCTMGRGAAHALRGSGCFHYYA